MLRLVCLDEMEGGMLLLPDQIVPVCSFMNHGPLRLVPKNTSNCERTCGDRLQFAARRSTFIVSSCNRLWR